MTVTVFGLGFVGLTTALGLAEYGHKVYGVETDAKRLETIRGGELPFCEPGLDEALRRHLGGGFFPTEDWKEAVTQSQVIYFCVGTPYGPGGQADLTYLYDALLRAAEAAGDGRFRVLAVKSTIPPSTTETRVIPFLREHGAKIPEEFGVANNPEFLREGHCWEDFIHADRIVFGVSDSRSGSVLKKLYQDSGIPVYCVSSNTGEFIKYLSNTVLACLISFSNEMSLAAEAVGGIDVAEAFRILHLDKRWQTGTIRNYFYPGCGYGGYCLPKDTNAFYAAMKGLGFDCAILKNVISTNESMPGRAADRIARMAGGNPNKCIGILGLSFNPGSDDVRDTPSAKIIQALNDRGYQKILAYDPAAMDAFQARYPRLKYRCGESCESVLKKADLIAITTAWPEFSGLRERTEKPIADCRFLLPAGKDN